MENEGKPEILDTPDHMWKVETDQSEVGVDSVILATFHQDEPGRPISKNGMRKHLVIDRNSDNQPEPGKEYLVRVRYDTNPGVRGGVFIAEILDESPSTKIQTALTKKLGVDNLERIHSVRLSDKEKNNDDSIRKYITEYSDIVGGRFIALKYIFDPAGHPVDGGITLYKTDDNIDFSPLKKDIISLSDIGFKDLEKNTSTSSEADATVPEDEIAINLAPIQQIDKNTIVFLDTEVDIRGSKGPLVPSRERFRNFCQDENTMATERHIASAYQRRSPLFLEGDTATSKTSSVEHFASEIGAEVRRLNLSGQTDTSELIGKFVPNDGSIRVAFEKHINGWNSSSEEEWENAQKNFKPETIKIMESAREEHRVLSKDELSAIALAEGFHISETQWIWQDGILPQAMKKGQILILDEVTLAESQILERINSALENPPSVVLTENGGVKIGPGGDFEVADGFWIVATGNPAGYAGRNTLSDAFIRRFSDYYRVPNPTQEHFTQMLTLMIDGKQPDLNIDGVKYTGPKNLDAQFAELSEIPEIKEFVMHLAAFHMDIVRMSDPKTRTIGTERHRTGGKYIFTRDTLVAVLNFISKDKILDRVATARSGTKVYVTDFRARAKMAIERFYLSPVVQADRQSVRDAMNKYSNKWLA